jgi:hypothetical protein
MFASCFGSSSGPVHTRSTVPDAARRKQAPQAASTPASTKETYLVTLALLRPGLTGTLRTRLPRVVFAFGEWQEWGAGGNLEMFNESFLVCYGPMPLRPLSSTAPTAPAPTAPAPTDSLAAAVAGMASPPPRSRLPSKLEPDISLLIE